MTPFSSIQSLSHVHVFSSESVLHIRWPKYWSFSYSIRVLPKNIQDWFPLGLTGLISLQSKGLSRVFSNITVQNHQFFSTQPVLWSNSHIHTWLLGKPWLWLSSVKFSSVAQLCPTLCDPMDCSMQASLSITTSWSLLEHTSIESVMPSNHFILCFPLLLPSVFPNIRVFASGGQSIRV